MKRKYAFLVIGLLSIVSVGCKENQSNSNGPHIYADFYVRWLQDTQDLRAEATFKAGKVFKNASSKTMTNVSFLGSAMQQKNFPQTGIRYQYNHTSKFLPEYTFRYNTDDDQRRAFSISMPPLDVSLTDTIISKATGAVIHLQNEPLRQDESLVLLFNSSKNEAAHLTVQGPIADKRIVISGDQFKDFASGTGELTFIKRYKLARVEEGFNERGTLEVYGTPFDIVVK